jgi:antitoxin (DNA-binding transcriptional repressor) of toxin-antitoxin stability system
MCAPAAPACSTCSTRATLLRMTKSITHRELHDPSGEIMRGLDRGESFVVTRNGVPVGELVPVRRRRFVTAVVAVAAFQGAPEGTSSACEQISTRSRIRTPLAATALANGLPLYTCNSDDFDGLTGTLEVVAVEVTAA